LREVGGVGKLAKILREPNLELGSSFKTAKAAKLFSDRHEGYSGHWKKGKLKDSCTP
jgi:hypothetical protein